MVPAARTVLFDGVRDRAALVDRLAGWRPGTAALEGDLVEIPVVYDGADLDAVARAWRCSVDDVVERHVGTEFTASFCGFAPGFSYLAGLPEAWAVPRLPEPRTRVPAGSVALADTWCGIYPTSSPGRLAAPRPHRRTALGRRPGRPRPAATRHPREVRGPMTLTVLDPGLLTTVQDRGRHGCAHLGVPRAGALDAPAAALANRLVGNPVDAAVLETTMTGASVRGRPGA